MAENTNSPIFADRYRFEPVGDDWDTGRSGYTHLVYDLKEKRRGVIKRVEIISRQAVEGLKNEVRALKALKGLGVPEVYDTGQAIYGSKTYFYMIIEYIEGMRVEKDLNSLSAPERADILTKFFSILTLAHRQGIVNGDVDLKHLFWRRDKKQLIVIDWGNARLDVDSRNKTEFTYDLARSAEIIFALVTRQGHVPSTGSIALPNDSAIVPGLSPLPFEFRDLCKWAPRTPANNPKPPYTALELLEVSKKWSAAISKPHQAPLKPKRYGWVWIPIIVFVAAGLFWAVTNYHLLDYFLPAATTTPTVVTMVSPDNLTPTLSIPTNTPVLTETTSPILTPTETSTPTIGITAETPVLPSIIPSPLAYSSVSLIFKKDKVGLDPTIKECLKNQRDPSLKLKEKEGFYRKGDDDWWGFSLGKDRDTSQPIRSDFSECLGGKPVGAMALNAFVSRLEPEKETASPREFGFFLEGQNGAREYTLWVDKDDKMYLRVRESGTIISDDPVLIVSKLEHGGIAPSIYDRFPIQIFLEIDNHGSDILYMFEGPNNFVEANNINPSQMIRIDNAVRPNIGVIQKIGLVGYGGQTDVIIWPLVFFSKP